ncbi:group 1 glycosyl transferase [Listeria grandensis FSL F6-0971]|uniref:Group 1 glycosyl transferase n=1 Tax=Listeria grandensis FSL F6-0971 TaxID=1265819 RepID=W7B5X1_9LIST|nr:glycosyltransferase family 4 protein [Listeria grandensis]EUJ18226.1 group 1 glycosyl transferase [Listeria grandensis FSL F6-0971]
MSKTYQIPKALTTMKSKLLIISQVFEPEIGSGANRITSIYHYISKVFEVEVLTNEPSYPNDFVYQKQDTKKNSNITRSRAYIKHSNNMIVRLFFYAEITISAVLLAVKRSRVDIVFLSTPPLFLGLAALFVKRKKLVIDIRDLWTESLRGIRRYNNPVILCVSVFFEKMLYKRADLIIINSEGFYEPLEQMGICKSKIKWIPNSIEAKEFMLKNAEPSDVCKVIYSGNVGLAQDMDMFLELAADYLGDSSVQFEIIGYGSNYQALRTEMTRRNLVNINILGVQTREETLEIVSKSDIAFVGLVEHPAFENVLPGKIVDYLGLGIPIIGQVSGYSKSIIDAANAGVTFTKDSFRQPAVARALHQLFRNVSYRQALAENAFTYANKHFSASKNYQRLADILLDTMEGK